MEALAQQEETQNISYRHQTGEVFEVDNLDTARGMCPVLGKMSLEEAGLLLELEAMGEMNIAKQGEEPVAQTDSETKPDIYEIRKNVEEPITNKTKKNVPLPQASLIHPAESLIRTVEEYAVIISSDSVAQGVLGLQEADKRKVTQKFFDKSGSTHVVESVRHTPPQSNHNRKIAILTHDRDEANVVSSALATDNKLAKAMSKEPAQSAQPEVNRAFGKGVPESYDPSIVVDDNDQEAVKQVVLSEQVTEVFEKAPDPKKIEIEETKSADVVFTEERQIFFEFQEDSQEDHVFPEQLLDNQTESEQIEIYPTTEDIVTPATLTQIDTVITEIVEALEGDETTEIVKINEIIHEITALSEVDRFEKVNNDKENDEKIEELFIELFKVAKISTSPELIISFVKLYKANYLEELFNIDKSKISNTDATAEEVGTREFLQKLQIGLSIIKQSVISFYEVGKSILRLYSIDNQIKVV